MKKYLLILSALLLTAVGASAQYVDYTSKMSVATTDWTVSGTNLAATTAGTFRTGVEYYNDTATNFAGLDMSQTITGLPAGTYTVSFYAAVNEANSSTNNQSGTEFRAYVQDATVAENYKTGTVGTLSGSGISWGDNDDLPLYTFTVTLTDGQSLKYGISNTGGGGNWAIIQPVSLILSVDAQTEGDVVHDCLVIMGPYTSSSDRCWPLNWSSNTSTAVGNFHVNTWSSEGATDGTGMTTPFIEYWFGSGTNVADAVLSHDQLTGLTPGLYEVSVLARAYNEGSSTAVGEGITFNANSASVDLTTGTVTSGTTPAMAYGTYTLVAEVGDAGTLDINFTIQSETSCDWLSWKDLKVVYDGESLPDLTYVTGDMNATVEATMKAAVDAYNTSKSSADYTVALAAIEAAEESAAQYAEIAALVANLDTDGAAVWAETASGSAYTAKTLTTSDDISEDMVAAQIAQTTANSDMSYVLTTGKWSADQGNGPSSYNSFAQETYIGSGEATSGKVLYCTVEGLQSGTYTVSFYATANMANGVTGDTGSGISVAYANSATSTTGITVGTNSGAQITSLDDMTLYTVECKVADGTLEFGIENVADGGNWFLCAAGTLTLVSLSVEFEKGEEVHSCEAEFDHWSISGNTGGLFQRNTWSGEADPSGLVTPFIEYWVGAGYALEDATISHTQLTGLPEGFYEVSIFARAFNENSLVEVSEGITFNANKESIDLNKETHATYNHVSAEEYGTYTVYCEVDETGTLDINLTLEDVNCDWLAFKNLEVVYMGTALTDLPTLTAGTGTMNSDIASAQTAALAAYTSEATLANYNAAYQAVECARVSIAFYAGIEATLAELNLDETGQAAFSASEAGAAYEAQTLTYQDMTPIYVAAVLAQTTINSDMTYALVNSGTWMSESIESLGTYLTGVEAYAGNGVNFEVGKNLYKNIEGFEPGATYKVTFYAAASATTWESGVTSGSDITQIFANDTALDIDVVEQNTFSDLSAYSRTLTCTVGADGVLEFGLQNIAEGANWYVAQEVSLTYLGVVEETVTWTMTDANWGTLILPFAVAVEDVPTDLTIYTCDGTETSTDTEGTSTTTVTATAVEGGIAANTPYLVKGNVEKDTDYTFTGTPVEAEGALTSGLLTGTFVDMDYDALVAAAGNGTVYLLQNHGEGDEAGEGLGFYPVVTTGESSEATLTANHCYLTLSSGSGVRAFISLPDSDGEATGIVAVESDLIANDAIYDLSGRRVSKAVKGVYIQNGKKVLVK